MDGAERKVLQVLLEQLCSAGLISKSTCSQAEELVHSVIAMPDFFRYPGVVQESEGAEQHEYSKDP